MDLINLIIIYFSAKKLSLLTAFLCWSPERASELVRRGRSAGLRVGFSSCSMPAYRDHREGVVLDLSCPHTDIILAKASSSRAFNLRHSWLLLHQPTFNETLIQQLLSDVAILPDADVVVVSPDAVVDVYRIQTEQPLILTKVISEFSTSPRSVAELWARLPTAVSRRKNLRNVYVESATIVSQPEHFRGWGDLSNRHIDTYPKLTYPLLVHAAEDLNFRMDMRQVELYGEERNGSFDGLAGVLATGRAELGVASMFMRADRWRVLHYCSETVVLRGSFIFRQPARSAVSNVFLLPFSRGVWAAAAAVFAGSAGLLALAGGLARRTPRTPRTPHAPSDPELARLTLSESFTFAIGTVCQQGSALAPQLLSVRVLMLCTLLASLFTFTSYSAKIVAILQAPSDAIQTIDHLTQSPMAMGIQETTYKRVYFAESTEPATQRLYRRKLLPLGERAYLSVADGVARMRTGLFAFQVEESSGYDVISKTFTEREKCGLKQIAAFTLPMVAVPLRRHSGLRDLLAARLRWQREVGIIGRYRRMWMSSRPRCAAEGAGFVSVGLRDVAPAAHLLLSGALLLAERAVYTVTDRNFTFRANRQRSDAPCSLSTERKVPGRAPRTPRTPRAPHSPPALPQQATLNLM